MPFWRRRWLSRERGLTPKARVMAEFFGSGQRLVIASHNAGKVVEIRDLLAAWDVEVVSAADLGLAEPVEDGDSFEANAVIKAQAASRASGLWALADDSGLCVEALGGRPGIHSARWARGSFREAMDRIAGELAGRASGACFVCVLALAGPGGVRTFRGEVHGFLRFPPCGERGFGYDPIFVAEGMDRTFGELDPVEKHGISHRARAFGKLLAALPSA